MAGFIQSTKVDWDLVDEELDGVPDNIKDPRFDSLRHVLDILSAVDAEAALEELKSQQERIESLVDNVVQGYHSGFNKAIHNYSQILHLFSVSKDQVKKLRSQLEDAQRRLVSRSQSLELQWKRGVMLGDTVRLLSDIGSFVGIQQRVQKLQEAKDWTGAVAALLEGCSKLSRPEYPGIGALKEIKRELAARRNALLKTLVAEMERFTFEELAATRPAENGGSLLEATDLSHSPPRANGATAPLESTTPRTPRAPVTPRFAANGTPDSSSRQPSASGTEWRRSLASPSDLLFEKTSRREPASGNAALEGRCRELAVCIAQIGGLAELQAALRRHLPDQVRNVLLRALKEAGGPARPMQPSAGTTAGKVYAINPATAEAAARLVGRAFDQYLQVIQNLAVLLRVIGSTKSPPMSAGLELLLAASSTRDTTLGGGGAAAALGTAYLRRELDFAWDCMQREAQALLTELLQPGNLQSTLKDFQPGMLGSEGSKLSFSFDVQGVGARSLLKRENSLPAWSGEDLAGLVSRALWGFQGSPYLTAHIYQPAKEFAEEALLLLTALAKEPDASPGGGAWFGAGDCSEPRNALKTFLASSVENSFIPTVFLDFKTRCAEILQDPEAMRARAKPQAAYNADPAKGRPLLPAAKAVEVFVEELLQWAALMPLFATRLTGILENILGKVLEAFQERADTLLGGAACRVLAEDPALAIQMAAEPAATQAGEPAAFFVGRSAEGIDHFVASILQSGFAKGGEAAELAILQRVLKERPVRAAALLAAGDVTRHSDLAAMADSLDYLADVIQGAVLEHGDTPLAAAEQPATPRARRASSDSFGSPVHRAASVVLDSLHHLADRYRSLTGRCLRALRLDMLLLVIHHLGDLPKGRYVCEAAEAQDIEDCIGALQRSAARADDGVAPFLPANKRAYLSGGMAAAAARFVMWLLPELKSLNQAGLARVCRMLAVLQPFLAALGAAGGLFRPEAARQLERARAYYAHLTYSPSALTAVATARPTRFTLAEYTALLQVEFVGRAVSDADRAELAKAVLAATKKNPKSLAPP